VPLTKEQRAELDALGPETVRGKMIPCAVTRDANVAGFKTGFGDAGYLTRGHLEDWLADKSARDATERRQTLRWAKIAGWAAIIGVGVGIAAIIVAIWLAKRG
jgi:hypothetical protein